MEIPEALWVSFVLSVLSLKSNLIIMKSIETHFLSLQTCRESILTLRKFITGSAGGTLGSLKQNSHLFYICRTIEPARK